MPEPTLDRPSRNYEFLFLFTKQPDYYFNRRAIDVPSRSRVNSGDRAERRFGMADPLQILSDSDNERKTCGGSTRRHPRTGLSHVAARVGETDVASYHTPWRHVLDPFAGSGTLAKWPSNSG